MDAKTLKKLSELGINTKTIDIKIISIKTIEDIFNAGRGNGRKEGYEEGYDNGFDDGYSEGNTKGYDKGFDEGTWVERTKS